MRLKGFKLHKLNARGLDFAPAGRSHELSFDCPQRVHIEVLRAPSPQTVESRRELDLMEALARPVDARVIVTAWVVEVEEATTKTTREGEMDFRVVWLAPNPNPTAPRVRWSLWKDIATNYGQKQLHRQHVRLRGVKIKEHAGRKELTGCWQNGGIELLPQ